MGIFDLLVLYCVQGDKELMQRARERVTGEMEKRKKKEREERRREEEEKEEGTMKKVEELSEVVRQLVTTLNMIMEKK